MKRNLRFILVFIMFASFLVTMILFLYISRDEKPIYRSWIISFPFLFSIVWGIVRPKKRILNVILLLLLLAIEILLWYHEYSASNIMCQFMSDGMHLISKRYKIEEGVISYWIIFIIGSIFSCIYTLACCFFYKMANPKEDPNSTIGVHDGLEMLTSEDGPLHFSASKPLMFTGILYKILNGKSNK